MDDALRAVKENCGRKKAQKTQKKTSGFLRSGRPLGNATHIADTVLRANLGAIIVSSALWLVLLSNGEGQGRVALPRELRDVPFVHSTYGQIRSAHLQKRVVSSFSLKCQRCLVSVPLRLPDWADWEIIASRRNANTGQSFQNLL